MSPERPSSAVSTTKEDYNVTNASGATAVRRLTHLKESLERSVQAVERELAHRSENADYKNTYLTSLRNLCQEAEALEDAIRTYLHYA